MTTSGTPPGGPVRRLTIFLVVWLGVLAALTVPTGTIRTWADQERLAARSTPDSDPPAEEGDPQTQRRRLLDRLGISLWHKAGHKGAGLKVAVLDTGFSGYREHLGKALPQRITVKSFRTDGRLEVGDSQHGILCGEVIHALAPEAELLIANWEPDRPDSFLAAVRWARQEGARVISCSVIMPTWSDGEGHGAVHDALARILGGGDAAGDVLLFASAGNTAQRHWSGVFRGGVEQQHEWLPGRTDNLLRPWGTERVSVELCWTPGCVYELSVRDLLQDRDAAQAVVTVESDRCHAFVRFMPEEGHTYAVRVRLREGTADRLHLTVLGGGLQVHTTQGSIPFPGDGSEVVAVGAVDSAGKRCSYSSCGGGCESAKPDFVAQVPFPSLWRSKPFAGTSAAAPQAAALAAVLWGRHPTWSARKVRESLKASVRRLAKTPHDCETGYGRIELP
jgi:hypothetical protein